MSIPENNGSTSSLQACPGSVLVLDVTFKDSVNPDICPDGNVVEYIPDDEIEHARMAATGKVVPLARTDADTSVSVKRG